MQVVVASTTEVLKLCRPSTPRVHAFTAIRLLSTLVASAESGGLAQQKEALANLKRIRREADLLEQQALDELLKRLLRAEKLHRDDGYQVNVACGRASAEWPELQSCRHLWKLGFVWKTASGNLERRLHRFREVRCPERAHLLDVTLESCVIVEQAPPSKIMRLDAVVKDRYCQHVLKPHEKLHGRGSTRRRRAERRDAGRPRAGATARLGPTTEDELARQREAAIAEVVAAPSRKRARTIRNAPLGLARITGRAGEESAWPPCNASAIVVERLAKRAEPMKTQKMSRSCGGSEE